MTERSVIFIFADGVGLAPASPDNPFAAAATPALRALLGGPLTSEQVQQGAELLLKDIDATLGVPGLPQSGTGHVALLAGVNAPALLGRHQPHAPPTALHALLAERSIFQQVQERGGAVAFANVFGPNYWRALAARRVRRSASVIAAEGAGLALRDLDDLLAGRAAPWDLTGAALREHERRDLPLFTPAQTGGTLAALAREHALVFFEYFLPDLAGHGRGDVPDHAAIELLDGLLGGVLAAKRPHDTLLLTSDHGNIEDRTTPVHTRNPVPLLASGPAAAHFAGIEDIAGVAGALMNALFTAETQRRGGAED